jgi:hypothetical protein
VTDRERNYSTSLKIIGLKKNGKKYQQISRQMIPLEVIEPKFQVIPSLGVIRSGETTSKEELLRNPVLRTHLHFEDIDKYQFPCAESFTVVSCSVIWDTEEGDIVVQAVQGDRLRQSILTQLEKSLKPGATLTIEDIKVKGNTSGKVSKIPSLIFYIQ